MLGGNHYRVQTQGLAVLVVLHGDLGFAVRAQAGDNSGFTNRRKGQRQPVGQHHRQRQHFGGLVTGVAYHDTLVTGTQFAGPDHLSFFQWVIHPSCDIRALPVKQQINGKSAGRVADAMHHRLNNAGDPGYMAAGDLAGHHDMAAGRQNFAGHTGQRVMGKTIIQHAVCDLVAQFVGMSFGHRFGGIKALHFFLSSFIVPGCGAAGRVVWGCRSRRTGQVVLLGLPS